MDARAWDARYAAAPRVWTDDPHPVVVEELADLPPGRALDLAAGEGRHARWLARRGWQVTAVDYSTVALARGRELSDGLAIAWVPGDATRWEQPTSYDVALVAYLHLPPRERRAALRHAFDALVPGGTLLVLSHDRTNLTEGTGGPQDPEVLMSAEDVLGDLAPAALTVARAGRVRRSVAEGHGEQPARPAWDCVVRLTRG